jgi:hypothetical protein
MTSRNPLLPNRHPQQDFFVCDIVDAAIKGDMGSMEHPVFIHVLEAEWQDWVEAKNITVHHPDKNFISFCKKRGPWKNEELF